MKFVTEAEYNSTKNLDVTFSNHRSLIIGNNNDHADNVSLEIGVNGINQDVPLTIDLAFGESIQINCNLLVKVYLTANHDSAYVSVIELPTLRNDLNEFQQLTQALTVTI